MDSPEPDEPVAISALQHYSYCPRQCALIHMEQVFEENLYTLRGRAVHTQVDTPEWEMVEGVRVERALPLYSRRLGLVGKADVVEFLRDGTPYPVEYKHGPRRPREHDDLQLAAQALCLEEMTGRAVPRGAIFHHGSRRRREVRIDAGLREAGEHTTVLIPDMLASGRLPPPAADDRCQHCSLLDACQPWAVSRRDRLQQLRAGLFDDPQAEDDPCDSC